MKHNESSNESSLEKQLIVAIKRHDNETAQSLIKRKDININFSYSSYLHEDNNYASGSETALTASIIHKNKIIFDILINDPRININKVDESVSGVALLVATRSDNHKEYFLPLYNHPQTDINKHFGNNNRDYIFYWVIREIEQEKNLKYIKFFIKDPNLDVSNIDWNEALNHDDIFRANYKHITLLSTHPEIFKFELKWCGHKMKFISDVINNLYCAFNEDEKEVIIKNDGQFNDQYNSKYNYIRTIIEICKAINSDKLEFESDMGYIANQLCLLRRDAKKIVDDVIKINHSINSIIDEYVKVIEPHSSAQDLINIIIEFLDPTNLNWESLSNDLKEIDKIEIITRKTAEEINEENLSSENAMLLNNSTPNPSVTSIVDEKNQENLQINPKGYCIIL